MQESLSGQLLRRLLVAIVVLLGIGGTALADGTARIGSGPFVPAEQLRLSQRTPRELLAMEGRQLKDMLTTVAVSKQGRLVETAPTAADLRVFMAALRERTATGHAGRNLIEGPLRGKTVIGPDGRVQVVNTTAFPWRAVGQVEDYCSGTLVGTRYVLTAAHCVYNVNNDTWYPEHRFAPARNGKLAPYGVIGWNWVLAPKGWTQQHLRDFDFAMIVLNQDVGKKVGYLSYGYKDPLPLYTVNINGYPADRPAGTMWHANCRLAPVTSRSPQRLYYDCDTFGGMSGSAVYAFLGGNQRVIYGIHAYGVDGAGLNGATRITRSVFQMLNKWKTAYR